jgi:hypothetical protein
MLGSTVSSQREKASQALSRDKNSIPFLQKALKSSDPEISRRAADILRNIAQSDRLQNAKRIASFISAGQFDLMIDRLVYRTPPDSDAGWRQVGEAGLRVVELEKEKIGKFVPGVKAYGREMPYNLVKAGKLLPGNYRLVQSSVDLSDGRRDLYVCTKTLNMTAKTINSVSGILVVSGDITTDTNRPLVGSGIGIGLVFCNGNMKLNSIDCAVVICGGDVEISDNAKDCLIVCRGKIVASSFENCVLVSGSTIAQSTKPVTPHLKVSSSTSIEKEAKPLGLIQFFEPGQAGIQIETSDGGLRVKSISRSARFAKAGLREGDLIQSLNGESKLTYESVRSLLRRNIACDEPSRFRVYRNGQEIDIRVPVSEMNMFP